jgi:hypothetical protein
VGDVVEADDAVQLRHEQVVVRLARSSHGRTLYSEAGNHLTLPHLDIVRRISDGYKGAIGR